MNSPMSRQSKGGKATTPGGSKKNFKSQSSNTLEINNNTESAGAIAATDYKPGSSGSASGNVKILNQLRSSVTSS